MEVIGLHQQPWEVGSLGGVSGRDLSAQHQQALGDRKPVGFQPQLVKPNCLAHRKRGPPFVSAGESCRVVRVLPRQLQPLTSIQSLVLQDTPMQRLGSARPDALSFRRWILYGRLLPHIHHDAKEHIESYAQQVIHAIVPRLLPLD